MRFAVSLWRSGEEFQPLETWRPEDDGPLFLVARPLGSEAADLAGLRFCLLDEERFLLWETGLLAFEHPDGYAALIGEYALTAETIHSLSGTPVLIELVGPDDLLGAAPLRMADAPPAEEPTPAQTEPPQVEDVAAGEEVRGQLRALLDDWEKASARLQKQRALLAEEQAELRSLRAALAGPATPAEAGALLGRLLRGDASWLEQLKSRVERMHQQGQSIQRLLERLGAGGGRHRDVLPLLARLEATRRFYQWQDFGWLAGLEQLRARRNLLERYFSRWGHVVG